MKIILATILLIFVTWTLGYPSGAPSTACKDLLPRHKQRDANNKKLDNNYEVQRSNSPYRVEFSPKNPKSGDILNITIKGEDTFQGFIIRMYDDGNKPVNGKFQMRAGATPTTCDADADTITQTGKDEKRDFTVTWEIPSSLKGNIYAGVTVLKKFDTFWKIKSDVINIK